jgi:hypothetical protein
MTRSITQTLAFIVFATVALSACNRDKAATAESPVPAPATSPAAPASESAATSPSDTLTVAEVQMAKAVGEDMRAAEPTTTFSPNDAIHAVVLTEGAGSATIAARWTYGADRQPVYQEEHRIEANGPGVNNFRITKPDGFPAGDYQVEILLDGVVASTREFKVQ